MGKELRFTDIAELEAWLDENGRLDGTEIKELSPHPSERVSATTSIRIELIDQLAGTHEAGTQRNIRDVILTANAVEFSNLGPDLYLGEGHHSDGIELLEAEGLIAFEIDVPDRLEIRCGELLVEISDEKTDITKPWVSDLELSVTVQGRNLPDPDEWRSWFASAGEEVLWRIFGSEAVERPVDPKDYSGWFLQKRDMIANSQQGLFFFSCRQTENGFSVHLQIENEDDQDLFEAAKRVVATFENAEVSCGNCRFTSAEWRVYVKDAVIPERLYG